jgi:hypothetical protein
VLATVKRTLSAGRSATAKLELGARDRRGASLALVVNEAGPGTILDRHIAFTS